MTTISKTSKKPATKKPVQTVTVKKAVTKKPAQANKPAAKTVNEPAPTLLLKIGVAVLTVLAVVFLATIIAKY